MKTLLSIFFVILFAQVSYSWDPYLDSTDCPDTEDKKLYECKSIPNSGDAASELISIHICGRTLTNIEMLLVDDEAIWRAGDGRAIKFPNHILYTVDFSESRYSLLIPLGSATTDIIADFELVIFMTDLDHMSSKYRCEKMN